MSYTIGKISPVKSTEQNGISKQLEWDNPKFYRISPPRLATRSWRCNEFDKSLKIRGFPGLGWLVWHMEWLVRFVPRNRIVTKNRSMRMHELFRDANWQTFPTLSSSNFLIGSYYFSFDDSDFFVEKMTRRGRRCYMNQTLVCRLISILRPEPCSEI